MYKDKVPIDIEIWDTPYGQEKFSEMTFYSQNYIQGKNGVIMCVNSDELMNEDPKTNEKNQKELMDKIAMLSNNSSVPISLFYTQFDSF